MFPKNANYSFFIPTKGSEDAYFYLGNPGPVLVCVGVQKD